MFKLFDTQLMFFISDGELNQMACTNNVKQTTYNGP